VRDARPADAAAVAGVHVRAWQVGYRGLVADDHLDGLRAEDRAGRYRFAAADPDAPATVLAVEDGEVVGFVTTAPSPDAGVPAAGEVLALYVDPASWRRGVGRRLLAEARARLAGRGCEVAVLWVLAGNAGAERFYVADGWAADGLRRRQELWGVEVDEVRYRRALP